LVIVRWTSTIKVLGLSKKVLAIVIIFKIYHCFKSCTLVALHSWNIIFVYFLCSKVMSTIFFLSSHFILTFKLISIFCMFITHFTFACLFQTFMLVHSFEGFHWIICLCTFFFQTFFFFPTCSPCYFSIYNTFSTCSLCLSL
jgi:hypothetical protein